MLTSMCLSLEWVLLIISMYNACPPFLFSILAYLHFFLLAQLTHSMAEANGNLSHLWWTNQLTVIAIPWAVPVVWLKSSVIADRFISYSFTQWLDLKGFVCCYRCLNQTENTFRLQGQLQLVSALRKLVGLDGWLSLPSSSVTLILFPLSKTDFYSWTLNIETESLMLCYSVGIHWKGVAVHWALTHIGQWRLVGKSTHTRTSKYRYQIEK